MSVVKLLVEGKLEFETLNPILKGTPMLQQGGSKNALKPRARTERSDNKILCGYLRDRDFDYDPPDDLSMPTLDCEDNGVPMGWRWCRHEIENYLIEPLIIHAATGWPVEDIEQAIRQAGQDIRSYQAARWKIGVVRRVLPPHFKLKTRPKNLNEIALPQYMDEPVSCDWATNTIQAHRQRIDDATEPSEVILRFNNFIALFNDEFVSNVSSVLLWFSGKDIMAGMDGWLNVRRFENTGSFRALLRDWIRENPERTLELLPEWNNLVQALRS